MKNKFYVQLDYGNLETNDTAFGNRLMLWEGIYDYIDEQNLLEYFEIVLLSDRWKEKKYIKLKNTIFQNTIPNDVIRLTKTQIDNNTQIFTGNDYYYCDVLLYKSFDRNNTHEKIELSESYISEKLQQFKKEKPLISLHIRKVSGIIGSVYSENNLDGYPDFTWGYYNSLIKIIDDIMKEKDYNLYVGTDLPIEILRENLYGNYLTRLDFCSNEKEIELSHGKTIQEESYEESNMCDWIAFYYSDIIFTNKFSTFSMTAGEASNNLILSMFQWSHEWKPMIEEYLYQQNTKVT